MIIDPVIYAIINVVNEKHYVGQASEKLKRFREHKKTLRGNYHCNVLLQRAFNKYGEDKFIFVVLENLLSCGQLNAREQHWINLLQPEYNLAPVAGSLLGYKHSDEARANMSKAHIGKPHHSEEEKKKRSERWKGNQWNKGRKQTKDRIEHRTKFVKGRKHDADTLAKMSASQKGRVFTDGHKKKLSIAAQNRKKKA